MAMVLLTPTPMAMVIFDRLTYDVALYLFQSFSGKLRSGTCSVSKLWYEFALTASKSLSKVPMMYNITTHSQISPIRNMSLSDVKLREYSLAHKYEIMRDYHLVVRLKCQSSLKLYMACYGGCMDVVMLVLNCDKYTTISRPFNDDFDKGLYNSAYTGNIKIMDLMISRGADVNEGLKGACMCNNIPAINYMLARGATNYNAATNSAVKGNSIEALIIMLSLSPSSAGCALKSASKDDRRAIIDMLLEKYDLSQKHIDYAFIAACNNNHYDLAEYLLTNTGNNDNPSIDTSDISIPQTMVTTILNEKLHLVDNLGRIGQKYQFGSTYDTCLDYLCENSRITINAVKYIIDRGAVIKKLHLERMLRRSETVFMYVMSVASNRLFIVGFMDFMTYKFGGKFKRKLDEFININLSEFGRAITNEEVMDIIKGVITVVKLEDSEFIRLLQPQIDQLIAMMR